MVRTVGLVLWFRDICIEVYPLDMMNGVWSVSDVPGLGIEIDETVAARYLFKQEEIPALEAILSDGRIANWRTSGVDPASVRSQASNRQESTGFQSRR